VMIHRCLRRRHGVGEGSECQGTKLTERVKIAVAA
jgi:hypothetical protein